jgi:DNA-binding NarL/FixJ family response regulator
MARLTPSEREVVSHLLCGSTNQDIAQQRGTSARTIANQVQAIFRKLHVQSRVELAIELQRTKEPVGKRLGSGGGERRVGLEIEVEQG